MIAPDLVVRPATDADLPWIVALESRADMLAFIGGSTLDQHSAWLADPDFRQVVAEAGGARVGYALLFGYASTPGVRLLRRIAAVSPERGHGTALLRHLIDEAFAEGIARFRLAVFDTNVRARHVYARFGFVPEPGAPVTEITRRDGITCLNLPLVLFRPAS